MKRKFRNEDFEAQSLPHNRVELFFDVLKQQWRKLLILGLLLFVGLLPIFALWFAKDYYAMSIELKIASDSALTIEEINALRHGVFIADLLSKGGSALLCLILAIFLAGCTRIIRQLAWSEPVFLKDDFFLGVKQNYKNALTLLLATSLILLINGILSPRLSAIHPILSYVPIAVIGVLLFPPLLLTYFQSAIYTGSFLSLFKNSILFYVKEAPRVLLITLSVIVPLLFGLMNSHMILKFILLLTCSFLFLPLCSLAYSVSSNGIFDRYINVRTYPELYRKGMNSITAEEKENKFIWAKEHSINQLLVFRLEKNLKEGYLKVYAANVFEVFIDGRLVSYGPIRTAENYAKYSLVRFHKAKLIEIKVLNSGVQTYQTPFEKAYFSCGVFSNKNELLASTLDFKAYEDLGRASDLPRFTYQRGFVEGYDFSKSKLSPIDVFEVNAPKTLGEGKDRASYFEYPLVKTSSGEFLGFNKVHAMWWEKECELEGHLSSAELANRIMDMKGGMETNFELARITTGILSISVESKEDDIVYLVFDEILDGDNMVFRRNAANNVFVLKVVPGHNEFVTNDCYCLKHLKAISKSPIKIKAKLIAIENYDVDHVSYYGDYDLVSVMDAAKATYAQTAVDNYMDCPGRERGGYLCDSYFIAKAERFFSGKSEIEKDFLRNFLLSNETHIPPEMLPMCYPSAHLNGRYIPNWSMFFVIECEEYVRIAKDEQMKEDAKERIYGILSFFDRYVNEIGLLENLENWVFVEWSDCNKKEHLEGVNIPSNMLYSKALKCAARMYQDDALMQKAQKIDEAIEKYSFNGEFFVDNLVRENGKLKRCDNHITETCQYYALFSELNVSEKLKKTLINEFGPLRKDAYPEVSHSNAFIGNYLRFMFLLESGEKERLIEEIRGYFVPMAEKTGTLWERDNPGNSCCHGFASSIAAFIYEASEDGEIDGLHFDPQP